jgi:hypothetical protein
MIDLNREHPLTLIAAAATMPGFSKAKTICYRTIWRWAAKGLKGVRLETVCVGGQRYTTREAVQRFLDSLTAVRNEIVSPAAEERRNRLNPRRASKAASAAAMKTLERDHGIIF